MGNYFLLSYKDTFGPVASAFAPKNVKLAQDLIAELDGLNEVPFELNLIELSVGKDGLVESDDLTDVKDIWLDNQPNSLAWPLFSERLKDIINKSLTGLEGLDWLTAKINGNGEQRIYYIPRFKKMLDVLDIEKTIFVQGTDHIIRPVFSLSKIKFYSMFSMPSSHDLWKITTGLYVSETLKKAIQKDKLKGVDFETTSVR